MVSFNDWCIQDLDCSIRVEGGIVSWFKADRTAVRFIGKQIEVSGDFLHSFVVCFVEGEVEDEQNQGFIRLWEIRNNWNNRIWIYSRKNGNGWTIHFEQVNRKDEVFAYQGSSKLNFNNRYTVKISRVGGNYRLVVKDCAGYIVEDSKEVEGVNQSYRFVWLASTLKSRRNNGNWSTGYIEKLTITGPL
jgi:hypothetical protein